MKNSRQGIKTRSDKRIFFFFFSILKKPQKSCKIKENKRISINLDIWASAKLFQPTRSERLWVVSGVGPWVWETSHNNQLKINTSNSNMPAMKLQVERISIFYFTSIYKNMLSDSQVFIALFVALITGILAVRLGTQLYK